MKIIRLLEYHNDVPALQLLIDSLPDLKNLGYQAIALEGISHSNQDTLYQEALTDIKTTRDTLLDDFQDKQDLINQLFPFIPKKLQRMDKENPVLRYLGSEHEAIVFSCKQWLIEAIDQLPYAIDDQKKNTTIKRLVTMVELSLSNHNHICLIDALKQYSFEILPLDPNNYVELQLKGHVDQRERKMANTISQHQVNYPNLIVKTGLYHFPITRQCSNVLPLFITSEQNSDLDSSLMKERQFIQSIERLFVAPRRKYESSERNDLTKRVDDHHIALATGRSVPDLHPYPVTTIHGLFDSNPVDSQKYSTLKKT